MLASLEKPAAYIALAFSLITLIWKSIGVDWIPLLGTSFTAIFAAPGDDGSSRAQYPRRPGDEDFWRVVYLLMYGVLGTAAQYGGILISSRRLSKRESLVFWSRVYALFHLIIGCHHLMWSFNKSYGKLELWRYDLPFVYELTGLTALGLIYHAVCIGLGTVGNAELKLSDLCSRKAVMDCCTCSTFISVVVFLLGNMAGMETSFEAERLWWALTMYPVPLLFLLGSLTR